ncbi:MAG: MotA/TolQ/ExbB proton channel family protein [SAR324 cluster bacterium]|nr:MotA/TolQ/ExbB proton channel family protein [SAR324 cluster bacterium]
MELLHKHQMKLLGIFGGVFIAWVLFQSQGLWIGLSYAAHKLYEMMGLAGVPLLILMVLALVAITTVLIAYGSAKSPPSWAVRIIWYTSRESSDLGLIGTVVGLMVVLRGLDQSDPSASIATLLNGAGIAMSTTLLGAVLARAVNLVIDVFDLEEK